MTSLSLKQGPPGESYGSEKGVPGERGPQVSLEIQGHVQPKLVSSRYSLDDMYKMLDSN